MRKVRGGREKDFVLKTAVLFQENWLSYLVIFCCGMFGVLLGFLIGKVSSLYITSVVVGFLAIVTAGLFVAWAINQRDQLLGKHLLQESLKQQYNAFSLLIGELEYNLSVEDSNMATNRAWQSLKYEWAFFPAHIYEEVEKVYRKIADLQGIDISEYRLVLLERLELPGLITRLKDWQQRVRRQLPYY